MFTRLRSALADGFRLYFDLVFLNLRKAVYIARGRRGRAPCQSNSDPEVRGRIRCDVQMHWEQAERFQRVCPLLRQDPDGWHCGVLSQDVRPFWGRVVKWYALGAALLYIGGVVVYWGGLNLAGTTPIPLWRVAWPAAWSSIARLQSEDLCAQSLVYFRRGEYVTAARILSGARVRDPKNFVAKLLMAQISMFQGNLRYADELYAELLREHPEQLAIIAVNFQDTLVSVDRMNKLGEHSLAMIARDPEHTALWVRSLLLALRAPGVAAMIEDQHRLEIYSLPDFARLLVEAQLLAAQGETEQARERLAEPFRGPWNPLYLQAQLRLLCRLGATDSAKLLLGYYGPGIGIYESMAQQYLIDYAAQDATAARMLFVGLMRTDLDQAKVLRLQLLLLEAPDRESFVRLHEKVLARPDLKAAINQAGMWITAVVCHSPEEAQVWEDPALLLMGQNYPAIQAVDFKSDRLNDTASVIHLINVMNLPREIISELLARMNEARAAIGPEV